MIKLLFGKAGSGKSYIGRVASLSYGFYFYDADEDLPESFRKAIEQREKVTDDVREEYIESIITKVKRLAVSHGNICVCQALPRNHYRERILDAIPAVEFVWVDAPDEITSLRLRSRSGHIAPVEYAEMANRIFEAPTVPYVKFVNGSNPVEFDDQMRLIFGGKSEPR